MAWAFWIDAPNIWASIPIGPAPWCSAGGWAWTEMTGSTGRIPRANLWPARRRTCEEKTVDWRRLTIESTLGVLTHSNSGCNDNAVPLRKACNKRSTTKSFLCISWGSVTTCRISFWNALYSSVKFKTTHLQYVWWNSVSLASMSASSLTCRTW